MFAMKLAAILLIACLSQLLGHAESKAIFGIGTRIIGDQLLVKDVLEARPLGLGESPTISFNYAIPEPITYIEIMALENVFADVSFNYQNDLVKGTITATNGSALNENVADDNSTMAGVFSPPSFEVLITIYGFNETVMNVNPAYILNKDQQFTGRLEPQWDDEQDYDEYVNMSDEALEALDDTHNSTDKQHRDDDDEDDVDDGDDDVENGDDDDDFGNADKIIEVGQRQQGDYLIYETYQTSLSSTQEPATHSVVFYYIDSNFISYVRFIVFDHTTDKAAGEINPPVAEYSHFSPHTLKAVITDNKTTSLFVQMFLYGYKPGEQPVDYKPFLTSNAGAGLFGFTESPLSALKHAIARAGKEEDEDAEDNEVEEPQAIVEELDSTAAANANANASANDGAVAIDMPHAYLTICLPLIFAATRWQRS